MPAAMENATENEKPNGELYEYSTAEPGRPLRPEQAPLDEVLGPEDAYYKRCVTIENERDLDPEFMRVASDFAYWAERYANAYADYLAVKEEYEKAEARAAIEVRETLLDIGGKSTEKLIEQHTKIDKRVVAARAQLIAAEALQVRMKQRVQAVERKKEMVQSIGANRREEMRGDPTIRKNLSREAGAYRGVREDAAGQGE